MAESTVWRLEKYARYFIPKKGATEGEWKLRMTTGQPNYFDDSESAPLLMTLTDTDYLVICQGPTVLESHSLITSRAWMRGLCKTDSCMFMYKIKAYLVGRHGGGISLQGYTCDWEGTNSSVNGTRRFRVKFSCIGLQTGSEVCADVARRLSNFFPVKLAISSPEESGSTAKTSSGDASSKMLGQTNRITTLTGEITLGQMAEIIIGETPNRLPLSYDLMPKATDVFSHRSISDDVLARYLRLFLSDPTFPAFVEQVDKQIHQIIKECRE